MDRAEKTGLGISAAAHVALFAALSLGLAVTHLPPPPAQPIDVSFVKDVGPTNAAPNPSLAPPAQSKAPEDGAPAEAAPPPVETPKPEPIPAPPPPISAEVSKPTPKPVEKPKPAPKKAAEKPQPAKSAAHAAPARPAPAPAKAAHNPRAGTALATRGTLLGHDFLKGIGNDPTPSKSQQAPASVMSAQALAGIEAAIQRQIQPCANRQVNPGPGANQIKVKLNLHLNRDGSLARTPTVVSTTGITSENARYEDRVKDLAVAAYVGCSPLRDLPEDLYQTPKGGWANFNMTYKLP